MPVFISEEFSNCATFAKLRKFAKSAKIRATHLAYVYFEHILRRGGTMDDWPGLQEEELWELERRLCAYEAVWNRADLFAAANGNHSIGLCSELIRQVWEGNGDAEVLTARPRLKEFNDLLGHTTLAGISNLLNGKANWDPRKVRNWSNCRGVMTYLLLGAKYARREGKGPAGHVPVDSGSTASRGRSPRRQIAERIIRYFFESDADGLPVYFTRSVADDRRYRTDEVKYDVLWLACQAAHGSPATLVAASGGSPFLRGDGVKSNETRQALLAAAGAGATIYLVTPDDTALRDRSLTDSIDELFDWCVQQGCGPYPEYLSRLCPSMVPADTETAAPSDDFRAALGRMRHVTIDPAAVKRKRWAGQFLNPVFKFIGFECTRSGETRRRMFMSRSPLIRPFPVPATAEECDDYAAWCDSFVLSSKSVRTAADGQR